jgi:hypothetical protein
MLRIDTAEHFLGVRLNVFTSIVVGLLALAYLVAQRGRPREVVTRGAAATSRGATAAPPTTGDPAEPGTDAAAGRRTTPADDADRPAGD